MARALWHGKVIAESPDYEMVEGNVYFPATAVHCEYLRPSPTITTCGWKGEASYYTIVVDGHENPDAAWYYRDPRAAAARIKDHVAFWNGVAVER
jgi:uncharacterized protein (DUF427 family)